MLAKAEQEIKLTPTLFCLKTSYKIKCCMIDWTIYKSTFTADKSGWEEKTSLIPLISFWLLHKLWTIQSTQLQVHGCPEREKVNNVHQLVCLPKTSSVAACRPFCKGVFRSLKVKPFWLRWSLVSGVTMLPKLGSKSAHEACLLRVLWCKVCVKQPLLMILRVFETASGKVWGSRCLKQHSNTCLCCQALS